MSSSRLEPKSYDRGRKVLSHRTTVYANPDRIKKMSGYRPTNCGEPKDVISNLSVRDGYRCATNHINADPYNHCCTIVHENDFCLKLHMWKVSELPVKLTKDKSSTTFLCFKELEYLKCSE